ncbi:MAG TPA: DMT family transporter [Actinomycetota bacterium]|nr:DMT family transporter [Actinomycetota bacterium]
MAVAKPSPVGASSAVGMLAVTVAALAWSTAPVVVKSSELTGLRFAMYRLWIGVAVYLVALLVTRRRLSWRTFRACAPGGLIFGVDISLAFAAFKLTSVADATVIGALSPVVIALVSARLLHERIGLTERGLAAVSFVGVGIVAIGSSGSPSWSLLGDLAAVASIATWTTYWFFSRRARQHAPAIEYMASVMIAAALLVTPVALLFGRGPLTPRADDWAAVVVTALVPGFIGHTLVAWSHSHVESWRSALITQCHPVFASVWAAAFLGERLTPVVVLGIAVVLAATGVVIVRAARRPDVVDDLEEAAEPAA